MAIRKKTTQPKPQNTMIAARAVMAVTNHNYTSTPGMCQKFVRQVIQSVYGSRFDRYHRGTAEESRRAWLQSPYAVDPSRGSVVGDILYKRATRAVPAGHVAIRVAGNKVAENSTTTKGRRSGAKGYRTLDEYGKVDLIVRLPVDE